MLLDLEKLDFEKKYFQYLTSKKMKNIFIKIRRYKEDILKVQNFNEIFIEEKIYIPSEDKIPENIFKN